jgi:hypothetical protein
LSFRSEAKESAVAKFEHLPEITLTKTQSEYDRRYPEVTSNRCLKTLRYLVLLGSAFVLGCHQKPLSDDQLASRFSANENWFDDVSSRYVSGQVVCADKRDADICTVAGIQDALSHLRENVGIQSVMYSVITLVMTECGCQFKPME